MSHPLLQRVAVACVVVAALPLAGAWAQSTTQGGLAGTIFDATNAIIPGARVVIRNDGTNAQQVLRSNASGYYNAPLLPPGRYTVTVTAPGFGEVRSNDVVVQINQLTQVDEHLSAGAESTVVEVTAAAPVLNFNSPVYGGHLDTREIESIPINNRRWSSLALTTPGVTNDTSGFGLLSFRAISPLLNNVEVDGADDNQAFFSEERGRTRAGYSTAQVAVREFQVNTGVYSAEFGRAVGGVVNSVTKTGTNQLHGELYFYNRDSSFASFQPYATNTTFDSATGTYVTAPYKPKDKRNQYGFGLGGPLIKDRLFFFYAFDQFKRNFPGTAKANNPTAFFVAPDAALATGYTCNTATGAITTPTKAAAASTVDKASCLLAARLGTTYSSAAAQYNTQLQGLLGDLGSVPRFGDQTINTPKLDWQINGHHHLSGLYHRLRWDSPGGVQTQATNNYAVDSFGTDFVKLDYGLAELESIFGTRWANELRYQYGRELNDEGRQNPSQYTTNNFTPASGVPVQVGVISSIGFNAGTPYYSFRVAYPDERKWQIGDTASVVLGRHNIKFGEDFVHNYDLVNNLYQGNGVYSYSSTTNLLANYFSDLISKRATCDAGGSGVGPYPCYDSFTQGFGPGVFALATQDYGVFAQDDWKVNPRLTLNLGVRYDYEKVPSAFTALAQPALPQTLNHPSDKNNVAPRIGFAWDPYGLGKTVVRGGYGLYYGRIFNAFLLNTYENTGSPAGQNSSTYTRTITGAPLLPGIASAPANNPNAAPPTAQFFAPNYQNPYAQQFDLAVQQELGNGTVLSVSYLGALGRELPNYLNVNLSPSNRYTFNYAVAAGSDGTCGPLACGTQIPVSIYSNRTQTGASAGTYGYNTPYPTYGAITEAFSNINSNYHALTVDVTKRASKYISFDANYTWAHALDFNQNQSSSPGTNNWYDPFANGRANYGNSNLDVPQRVVGWAILTAPGVSGHGPLSYLANGWSLKPLIQAQSGLPYSVNLNGTVPNQCQAATCLEAASSGLIGTGVSYIPQLGRNTQRLPRDIIVDARVQKEFTFAEKYNLQLFAEAFNLANHQNVTGVNSTGYSLQTTYPTLPKGMLATPQNTAPTSNLVYQPTFNTITAANSNYAYGTRQVQLAARLVF